MTATTNGRLEMTTTSRLVETTITDGLAGMITMNGGVRMRITDGRVARPKNPLAGEMSTPNGRERNMNHLVGEMSTLCGRVSKIIDGRAGRKANDINAYPYANEDDD